MNCIQPAAPTADDGCETRSAAHPDCSACTASEICRDGSCEAACDATGLAALFVVANDTPLGAGDQVAYDTLATVLGFAVTVVEAASSTTDDASGMDLVVVSSSVSSMNVGTKFTNVAVPVATWENALFIDPCHPAAAGLAGSTPVYTAPNAVYWAVPVSSATIIATTADDAGHAAVFAVEAGASLDDGTPAPARRMGLSFHENALADATDDAMRLLLASLCWAAGL
jgi:hypothetical protein